MKQAGYRLVLLISIMGCRKSYNPPAISSPGSYLVVEGVINSGTDSTFIKLSRTVNLSGTVTANPVLQAVLAVESDRAAIYPLAETSNGYYVSTGLNLDNTRKYRLRIQTNGELYLSDFVPVVNSPAIDSVNYVIKNDGLQIYVSTHDPRNATHYYRWNYNETWVFHSNYSSFFKSNGDTVLARTLVNDEVYTCWGNDTSNTINIASSAKLSKDVISNIPITFVASTSEKLGTEYSIIVKQYALTGDAYNFWVNLKKNTEQLGSIFDAQPSQINGNIHSTTNPSEPVIGYISAGAVASQRIFIKNQQLPSWIPTPAYTNCALDSLRFVYQPPHSIVPVLQEDEFFNYKSGLFVGSPYQLIPINAIDSFIVRKGMDSLLGHTGATPNCVDCTLRGTNKQPAFWK